VSRPPADANARIVFDAVIEHWQSEDVVVTCAHAAFFGDEFVMQLRTASGAVTTWAVVVHGCEPPIGEPAATYRWRLRVAPASPSRQDSDLPMP
jgi:hypothetical protein